MVSRRAVAVSQLRRPIPLVATPPRLIASRCSVLPSNGLSTLTDPLHFSAPADRQVAAAVDGEARVSGQLLGEHVGEQPLGEAAAVEPHPRRARDRALGRIGLDELPARERAGTGRPSGRREPQRLLELQRAAELPGIARALELVEERCIDEAGGGAARVVHGLREPAHERACGHHLTAVAVQQGQLAVRKEAREALVPAEQLPLHERDRALRGAIRPLAGHVGGATGTEASERAARLCRSLHDCEVVTEEGELDSSFELDEPELDSVELASLAPDSLADPLDSDAADPDSPALAPDSLVPDSLALDSPPLELLPLELALPEEVAAELCAAEPELAVLVFFAADEDSLAVATVARRAAAVVRAGSCPEASWA